jgi:hypothetical protein
MYDTKKVKFDSGMHWQSQEHIFRIGQLFYDEENDLSFPSLIHVYSYFFTHT